MSAFATVRGSVLRYDAPVMSEQGTLKMRPQSSPLTVALSLVLGAALGSSVYIAAEIRHQKQVAEHVAQLSPLTAAAPEPEPKPTKPVAAEVAAAPAEPEQAAHEDADQPIAPQDPKAQALAARTAAEQALLDEARAQLEADNAAAALATLDRMKKKYPRGTLVQERELLRVKAYRARGQTLPAKRAARKFAKSYPDSPHLDEIESLLN
jgi:hypothetical protein